MGKPQGNKGDQKRVNWDDKSKWSKKSWGRRNSGDDQKGISNTSEVNICESENLNKTEGMHKMLPKM